MIKINRISGKFLPVLVALMVVLCMVAPSFAEEAAMQASGETQEAAQEEAAQSADGTGNSDEDNSGAAASGEDGSVSSEGNAENDEATGEEAVEESGNAVSAAASNDTTGEAAVSASADSGETKSVKAASNNTIADGTYIPSSYTCVNSSGSDKSTLITCKYVTISENKTKAKIVITSAYYSNITIGETAYSGKNDVDEGTSTFVVPVEINQDYTIKAYSDKMSRLISYTLNITIDENSQTTTADSGDDAISSIISDDDDDDTDDPSGDSGSSGDSGTSGDGDSSGTESGNSGSSDSSSGTTTGGASLVATWADGTYQVLADTNSNMFNITTNSSGEKRVTLVKSGSKLTVTIVLTGTSYDKLYLGTKESAAKASSSKYIKYKESNGYYTYTFNISANQMNTWIDLAAHSTKSGNWFDRQIIFYTSGAKKVSSSATTVPTTKKTTSSTSSSSSSSKSTTVSASANTAAVSNATNLADGTYTADKFSWSGGSGKLSYIKCNKITVKNGRAYATIEFGSTHYDMLKANGTVYYNIGSGNSTFEIPVKLNANNTIIGRTTAMSTPHWVQYTIYIYSAAAAAAGDGGSVVLSGDTIGKTELSEEAPEIIGLEYESTVDIESAKLFKIYKYEGDITLVQVDISSESSLDYGDGEDDSTASDSGDSEYDEEGNEVSKTQNQITAELSQNNVVNYLIAPEDAELPAGIEKECIVITLPVEKAYATNTEITDILTAIGIDEESILIEENAEEPDYSKIVDEEVGLALLDESVIPAKGEKDEDAVEEATEALEQMELRFATLEIPVMICRAEAEADETAQAEWVKVYGAVFGCLDEAVTYFDENDSND